MTRECRIGCISQDMAKGFKGALLVACLCVVFLLPSCGGSAGSGSTHWQYTALGDSLAVGVLDSQGGYVRRYEADIGADTGVTVSLLDLGVNGAHSGDLLNSLQNDSTFRSNVSSAQVITWDIGGDDLLHAINLFNNGQCGGADNLDCVRSAVATFMPNWDAIVQQILTLRDKNNTIIRTMDIYNPFVAQLQANGQFNTIEPFLDQVNQHIAASAQANGIPMAQIHLVFNGPNGTDDPVAKGLLTVDGIHPNDAGHKVIADALRGLGYAPLK
jgi:lysophospholipase L1-like esterase